jgi:hypothetical protein
LFNGQLRDNLLFEDDSFTHTRRFFWASETLNFINIDIKDMVHEYETTFTDEVWKGEHQYIWPGTQDRSPQYSLCRKRMFIIRDQFQQVISRLKEMHIENKELQKTIRIFQTQLYSGTSILHSRKSVELSIVTILQGHNIKLLTLVSAFFLPLIFVATAFGMSNIPRELSFKPFIITLLAVCLPSWLLITTINTTFDDSIWRNKWHQLLAWFHGMDHEQAIRYRASLKY